MINTRRTKRVIALAVGLSLVAAACGDDDDSGDDEPAEAEEPSEEPAEEPSEEPAEGPSEEPAEEPSEEPAEEPSEEPSEEPAEEPAGDAAMVRRIQTEDLSGLKFRDKVAAAVRFRLEAVTDRELVRRGSTLFALPAYAPDGAKLIWGTADAIWTALGDTSEDINWYTKRASLSAVYSSTVLYWLGDDSPDHARTWGFLDRRIDGVMQFEKFKAKVRGNALLKPFLAGPDWALSWVKAPRRSPPSDLPGTLSEPE